MGVGSDFNQVLQQTPIFQNKDAQLAAVQQQLNADRQRVYGPNNPYYNPYTDPQFNHQQTQQVQQQPQQMPQSIVEQPKNNEYLQGHPIERVDQLREVIVGLDGRVSLFPLFSENEIYTKYTNLDGLPEGRRYILDETWSLADIMDPEPIGAQDLKPMLTQLQELQKEIREELKALREERENGTTNEHISADSTAVDNNRSKSDATATTATKSKSSNATKSTNTTTDAKG